MAVSVSAPGARFDRLLPEPYGALEASFRARADTRTEPMAHVDISMELHIRASPAQCCDSPFHHRRRGNSIALTDNDKVGGSLFEYSE